MFFVERTWRKGRIPAEWFVSVNRVVAQSSHAARLGCARYTKLCSLYEGSKTTKRYRGAFPRRASVVEQEQLGPNASEW